MKRSFSLSLAASLMLTLSPFAKSADIVETAVGAGQFKTLAAALGAADLAGALQGDGPFTVFAPTDEAFANLPEGTVENLLKPENKAKLQAILKYHVVAGQVPASKVVTLGGATTLNGQRVEIQAGDAGVKLDSANVIQTDIACDNGLIHVIDSVILPADQNLVETAAGADTFNTLIAAAKAAGLAGALTGSDDLTVFAPTDDAFAKLPEGTVESLLLPENKQKLATILKYHVVAGRVYSDAALQAGSARTLEGSPVTISADENGAMVNQAKLIATDLDASNGVIHVIDSVLLPPEKSVSACSGDACRTLEAVVLKGSNLYNSGHHGACADLYSETLAGMMDSSIGSDMKGHISTVLSRAEHQHRASDRAWTLRRGIDQMYTSLSSSN